MTPLPTDNQSPRGPCAKRQVVCTIMYGGSADEFVVGENDCANPQQTCPRAPGEGYEKCQSICQQSGHAEIMAVKAAQNARISLRGATAYLTGHHWICEPCGRALREAGITSVHIVLSR